MQKLLLLLLSTTPVLAQTSFHLGPRVGTTLATVRYANGASYGQASDYPTTYRVGFEAGVMGSWRIGHLAIQPAILFQRKGYYSDYEALYASSSVPSASFSNTVSLNYLTVPVNFVYTQRLNGQGFHVFAGPYLSTLVGGHYHSDYTQHPLEITGAFDGRVVAGDHNPNTAGRDDSYYKRLDAGLQAGLGYQYQQWLVQATSSWGLRDIAATYPGPPDANNPTGVTLRARPTHTRSFQLSLTHLFHVH
jgi:hypothetical protein